MANKPPKTPADETPVTDAPETSTANTPSEDLVTEGQKNDPAVAGPLDKNGPANDIAAPGESLAGEKKIKVRANGAFLVYDPYTLDCVDSTGGEMRVTEFVRDKIKSGLLEEI